MSSQIDQDELIAQFISINSSDEESARFYLESNNWDLNLAVNSFYESNQIENENDPEFKPDSPSSDNSASDEGEKIPQSAEKSKSSAEAPRRSQRLNEPKNNPSYSYSKRSNIKTLDQDSSEEQSEKEEEDWYAGGEKSGISIKAPGSAQADSIDLVGKILKKAAERELSDDESAPSNKNFKGKGKSMASSRNINTFDEGGSDRSEENQGQSGSGGPVTRNLNIWRNGFSIEDGELYRFDNPHSRALLESILKGQAPIHLLNVLPGQEVELRISKRDNEDYVPPSPKLVPFAGAGVRLGGISPLSIQGKPSGSVSKQDEEDIVIDESVPTTQIQVRLSDGSRLTLKLNVTHTISDIKRAIEKKKPESTKGRGFVLKTSFPSQTLSDENQTIEDAKLRNSFIFV
ncbi:hypothetical protein BB558_002882 [Smittium angustum]|uniref:SEP domain-containing protein n=1 Tax=Smittium angustum TaxID=133377 RepID=A0A2U1J7F6_SMIAN|nr:hypothetical protein BB558_002882 [Smittium angustum]